MKQEIVTIKCKGSCELDLETLESFQGNLKEMSIESYEKLKGSILRFGFIYPIAIWHDDKGKTWVPDGNHRVFTLRKMRQEGIIVPEKLPCVEVLAKNLKEAKEIALALSSLYAKITRDGLYEYTEAGNIALSELLGVLDLPGVDVVDFLSEFTDLDVGEAQKEKPKSKKTCPQCGHKF